MGNVVHGAGDKIVDADHPVAARKKQIGQMRPKKTGGGSVTTLVGWRLEEEAVRLVRVIGDGRVAVSPVQFRSVVSNQQPVISSQGARPSKRHRE